MWKKSPKTIEKLHKNLKKYPPPRRKALYISKIQKFNFIKGNFNFFYDFFHFFSVVAFKVKILVLRPFLAYAKNTPTVVPKIHCVSAACYTYIYIYTSLLSSSWQRPNSCFRPENVHLLQRDVNAEFVLRHKVNFV